MKNTRNFEGLTEWPMTKEGAKNANPKFHSPREGNFHGEEPITAEQYDQECEDIERVRNDVDNDRWPKWWFEKNGEDGNLSPLLIKYLGLSQSDPKGCATAVRMDHPYALWTGMVIPYLQDEGVELNQDMRHSSVPFVETLGAEALGKMLIWSSMEEVFDIKWAIGQSRLDEYSDWGESILMYPRPNHSESPAGHSSFAGSSAKAAEIAYKPNELQINSIGFACKQFANFRGFSAQHIWSSNALGYKVGYRQTIETMLERMKRILL